MTRIEGEQLAEYLHGEYPEVTTEKLFEIIRFINTHLHNTKEIYEQNINAITPETYPSPDFKIHGCDWTIEVKPKVNPILLRSTEELRRAIEKYKKNHDLISFAVPLLYAARELKGIGRSQRNVIAGIILSRFTTGRILTETNFNKPDCKEYITHGNYKKYIDGLVRSHLSQKGLRYIYSSIL